jgi:hypothetical protein
VQIQMADENAVSGLDFLRGILDRFRASGAIPRCESQYPAEGYGSMRLTLDKDQRTVELDTGGTLAAEPVGSCLAAELRRAIAAVAVPDSFDRSRRVAAGLARRADIPRSIPRRRLKVGRVRADFSACRISRTRISGTSRLSSSIHWT